MAGNPITWLQTWIKKAKAASSMQTDRLRIWIQGTHFGFYYDFLPGDPDATRKLQECWEAASATATTEMVPDKCRCIPYLVQVAIAGGATKEEVSVSFGPTEDKCRKFIEDLVAVCMVLNCVFGFSIMLRWAFEAVQKEADV